MNKLNPSHSLSRRQCLKYALYGGASTLLSPSIFISGCSRKKKPMPNIVIMLVDTLRPDRMSTYGYSKPTSPNIDALAKESVIFEQCNAPAPWTLPSIVSMLTSTFPCEHGVLLEKHKIARDLEPLASRLKKLDYLTLSLFVNSHAGEMSGLTRDHDYWKLLKRNEPEGMTVTGRRTGAIIEYHPKRPFYLYIHNIEPHDPYGVPRRFIQKFGKISQETKEIVTKLYVDYRQATHTGYQARMKREKGISDNTAQQQMYINNFYKAAEHVNFLYDASVRHADYNVGQIIETLKRLGEWDNTMFILLSDHGEEFGEHGGWQHDQSVYQELMHVPLIIRFPHAQFAGQRVKDTLTLVDLMPTIFDYMQRPDLMYDLRGNSFLPTIDGEPFHKPGELFVTGMRMNKKKHFRPFKETRGDINIVIRRDNYKGIFNIEPDTIELYDLTTDPAEKVDLSSKKTDLALQMKQYALKWYAENSAKQKLKAPIKEEKLDQATLENLKSLGYIE